MGKPETVNLNVFINENEERKKKSLNRIFHTTHKYSCKFEWESRI